MRALISPLCRFWICALLFSHAAYGACLGEQNASQTYSFEVVPQFTAAKVYSTWSPLLQRVGQETGMCFELRVAPNIPEFEQRLLRGEPQFVYLNPYHAVLAHQKKKYQPLLADTDDLLTGILVVRADSPIKSLEDLKGKNISFPAPNAFAASLLIRAELAKRKINTHAVFVKTHSNVYRSVIGQDAAAGGGVNNTLASEAPEVRQQLRVLFETSGYTPHPIVTLPSLPAPVREKFFKAFSQLAQDDEGRKLLSGVGIEKPQAVTYAKHYKVLESLQLEKFLVLSPSP